MVNIAVKMASVGSLQDEALKRKQRLYALKNRNNPKIDNDEPASKHLKGDSEQKLPKPIFRSYNPRDENLKEQKVAPTKPAEVSDKVLDQLEASKPQESIGEIDLTNLAPRKPDWDLKRDASKKLKKLERRTHQAIAELIRERLQTGKGDLVSAVNAKPNEIDDDD